MLKYFKKKLISRYMDKFNFPSTQGKVTGQLSYTLHFLKFNLSEKGNAVAGVLISSKVTSMVMSSD